MKKFAILIAILVAFAVISRSDAQVFFGLIKAGTGGGAAAPAACTNQLDFSNACNSQYIPVIL